jgi:hypothetical protein
LLNQQKQQLPKHLPQLKAQSHLLLVYQLNFRELELPNLSYKSTEQSVTSAIRASIHGFTASLTTMLTQKTFQELALLQNLTSTGKTSMPQTNMA